MVEFISDGNSDLELSPTDLKRFSFTTAETHFLFKGSFYDQIDEVALGSLLTPVLANLFMGHHEKIWSEKYKGPEVLFYRCLWMTTSSYSTQNRMPSHFSTTSIANTPTHVLL